MTEPEKARRWRMSHGLSQKKLGELTGYSKEAVCWFELGRTPPGRASRQIKDWVWQRYRLACAGLDAELRAGNPFGWNPKE